MMRINFKKKHISKKIKINMQMDIRKKLYVYK